MLSLSLGAIDRKQVGARCGRAVCIRRRRRRVTRFFALHVCSIHSAEKGKKGQVVAAGGRGVGETLAAAAAFRNLTFPFCPLLLPYPPTPAGLRAAFFLRLLLRYFPLAPS